jgi:hypothetical protein
LLLAQPQGASPLGSDSRSEQAAIKATILDYVEGWYEGDAGRMQRALHSELAKRAYLPGAEGQLVLDQMGAEKLVGGVRAGLGKRTPMDQRQKDVVIYDVTGHAATAKATMSGWVDYMHLVKVEGRWVILNVLWELKPREK